MRKSISVVLLILLSGGLLSAQAQAIPDSQQQDWALMWKLANDVVLARQDALKKLQEVKDYDLALKNRDAIKKAIEAKVPKGFVFDTADGKVKPAPEQAAKK